MDGFSTFTSSAEVVSTNVALSAVEVTDFPYAVESPVALWANAKVLVCGGESNLAGC